MYSFIERGQVPAFKLGRVRVKREDVEALLEAGADPIVVAGWIREVKAERLVAERELVPELYGTPEEARVNRDREDCVEPQRRSRPSRPMPITARAPGGRALVDRARFAGKIVIP